LPGMYFKGNIAHEESLRRLELIVNPGPDGAGGQDLTNASGGDPRWETRRGTSFPASPYTNQMFFRTDRGLEYYYDGTRWLSQRLQHILNYAVGITFPATVTATTVLRGGRPDSTYDMYLETAVIRALTNTTLDVTNNWTITLNRQDSVNALTSLGTVNTFQTGRVAGSPYLNTITVNAALTLTQAYNFSVDLTKNAAPGTLGFDSMVLNYRLIG
jgi:hypothetical protein